MTTIATSTIPAGDHGDQTSIVSTAAAESAPATVGGGIVPTLAESQHIDNDENNVKRRYSVTQDAR